MIEFARRSPTEIGLDLEDWEAALLRRLTSEMRQVLTEGAGDDPIGKRLFPNAYQDEEAARAYADLVGDDLLNAKVSALDSMSADLGDSGAVTATLSADALGAWLTTLTDMRLAIGTRLGVDETKMASEVDPDDPESAALAALHWLGWLQEGMLQAANDAGGDT